MNMRLSDLSRSSMMLFNIQKSRGRMDELSAQISSGTRLLTPDEDPEAYNHYLRFKEASHVTDGFIKNIESTIADLELYETTIDNITSTVKQFKNTVIKASNDAGYRDAQDLLKQNIENLLESMVSLANTNMKGKYMFSGSQTLTKPFKTITSGGDITDVVYQGDNIAMEFNPDSSERMVINLSGKEIFEGPAGMGEGIFEEMLSVMNDLKEDKFENADEHLAKIDSIHNRLINKRGSIGTNVRHLEVLDNFMDVYKLNMDEKAADIEGVDPSLAITELLNQEYVFKSTLEVAARLNDLTFIDYIH